MSVMNTATVTKLHPSKYSTKIQHPNTRRMNRALRRQSAAAIGIGLVGAVLTGLSLNHLAHGIAIVTGAPTIESWAMAIGIDLGFIAMELANLFASGERVRKAIARFTKPGIIGACSGSAIMNAFAFSALQHGLMQCAAIVLGLSIPAFIYCLMRIGAALYIDGNSR